MNAAKKVLNLTSILIVLGLPLGTFLNPVYAQGSPEVNTAPQILGQESAVSGVFSIIWGDGKDGKSSIIYTLTDVNGNRTLLQLDETVSRKLGGVLQFNGKRVSVQGTWATPAHADAIPGLTPGTPAAMLNVISISLAPSPESRAPAIDANVAQGVSGSKPWVTLMCKFSDIADEPHDRAFFVGMYGDTKPGMNHYWKELSFNNADITGSSVAGSGWYTLPYTESHYNPTDTSQGGDKGALATDCIAAADADVDFSQYTGINMMFNSDYDNGWAWGGGWYATLDGVNKVWSITWEPPWGYADISVIAHEMGHGFGLPHSTAIDWTWAYDNAWDVMSQDRYNCAAATDPTYGCMAQHTISNFKDLLGWIPDPRKMTVAPGTSATVILENLAAPASANYQMVKIPIGASTTNFYTVEARRLTGYDSKLPGAAVIIHSVDPANGTILAPVGLGSTDPGVMWTVGETFTDTTNDISVRVNSDTGTGFEVTISNQPVPPSLTVNPTSLNLTSTPGNCGDEQEIQVTATGLVDFYVALDHGNKFALCNGKKPCAGPWSGKLSNVAVGPDGHAYVSAKYTGILSNDSDTIRFKATETDPATLATVSLSGGGWCFGPPPYEVAVCVGWCPIWVDPWSWIINPIVLLSLLVLPVLAWAIGRNFGAAYQTNRARMIVAATGFAVVAVGGAIGAWIVIGTTVVATGGAVLRRSMGRQG